MCCPLTSHGWNQPFIEDEEDEDEEEW